MSKIFPCSTPALLAMALALGACGGPRAHYNPDILRYSWPREAQAEVPQACGDGATYGDVLPGDEVVLQRHRAVHGDRNWLPAMDQHVGRATHVTGRPGHDPNGCPVVQVEADQGSHFWRLRDLVRVGRGLGPGGGDAIPQRCEQDEDGANYGLAMPGATVVIWRHRIHEGDSNWVEDMASQVGSIARITRTAGVDGSGCPVVNVDADNGEWVWRVRDLTLVAAALPQACGEDGSSAGHGALSVGSAVRLGRHRPVDGGANWQRPMEQYVGRLARVTSLGPADDQGCPVVHVDADQGARPWRVRDLSLVDSVPGAASSVPTGGLSGQAPSGQTRSGGVPQSTDIPQACGQDFGAEDYGPLREGIRVVLGRHRMVDGDDNWTEEMTAFVGRTATVTSLSGSDAAGCPGIRVDLDGGEWFWRVRDVHRAF